MPPALAHSPTSTLDRPSMQTFGLSAVECAMVLESTDARRECAFFHDPNKGSAAEGSVQKSLA